MRISLIVGSATAGVALALLWTITLPGDRPLPVAQPEQLVPKPATMNLSDGIASWNRQISSGEPIRVRVDAKVDPAVPGSGESNTLGLLPDQDRDAVEDLLGSELASIRRRLTARSPTEQTVASLEVESLDLLEMVRLESMLLATRSGHYLAFASGEGQQFFAQSFPPGFSVTLQPASMNGEMVELVYVFELAADPSFQAATDQCDYATLQGDAELVQEFRQLSPERQEAIAALAGADRASREAAPRDIREGLCKFDRPGTAFRGDGRLALVLR